MSTTSQLNADRSRGTDSGKPLQRCEALGADVLESVHRDRRVRRLGDVELVVHAVGVPVRAAGSDGRGVHADGARGR